jgi:hypothetical protein
MKKLIPQFVISTLLAPVLFLLASSFSVQAQEYDDLYFTAGDRKKAKFLQEQESLAITNDAAEIDAKTVNPDHIVRYNRGVADKRRQTQDQENTEEYYVENYDRDNRNVIVNN